MANKRLDYLDMAKGIGIILVVLGHIVYTEQHIMIWIASFHMALFFVISGILMGLKDKPIRDIKAEIVHIAKGILIPYAWFSGLDFLLDIGNVLLGKISQEAFWRNLVSSVTFYGKSVLWFLTALFIAEAILIVLRAKCKDTVGIVVTVVIAAIAVVCKYGIDKVYGMYADSFAMVSLLNVVRTLIRGCIVLPYLSAGYYVTKYVKKTDALCEPKRRYQVAFAVILLLINIIVAIENGSVDTNNMILGNVFLYYTGGLAGSFAIVLLCKNMWSLKPLTYIGRNSLIIMATHLDCYILWAGLKVGMVVFGRVPQVALLVLIALVVTLLLSCIVVEVINRFMPFMVGKRKSA